MPISNVTTPLDDNHHERDDLRIIFKLVKIDKVETGLPIEEM